MRGAPTAGHSLLRRRSTTARSERRRLTPHRSRRAARAAEFEIVRRHFFALASRSGGTRSQFRLPSEWAASRQSHRAAPPTLTRRAKCKVISPRIALPRPFERRHVLIRCFCLELRQPPRQHYRGCRPRNVSIPTALRRASVASEALEVAVEEHREDPCERHVSALTGCARGGARQDPVRVGVSALRSHPGLGPSAQPKQGSA